MKRNIYLMAGIILLVFVWSTSSSAADKIGFINLQEIMQDSNAGKKAAEDFKKFYEKETQEIKSSEKELKKMKDELEKQTSIMTQSARNAKEDAYQKKLRSHQFLVKDTNEELTKRSEEIGQKLMPAIEKAVKNIAEKEKYVAIFYVGVPNAPVAYYSKENDFSKKVIEDFNKVK
jgi:Outer membrane protein